MMAGHAAIEVMMPRTMAVGGLYPKTTGYQDHYAETSGQGWTTIYYVLIRIVWPSSGVITLHEEIKEARLMLPMILPVTGQGPIQVTLALILRYRYKGGMQAYAFTSHDWTPPFQELEAVRMKP